MAEQKPPSSQRTKAAQLKAKVAKTPQGTKKAEASQSKRAPGQLSQAQKILGDLRQLKKTTVLQIPAPKFGTVSKPGGIKESASVLKPGVVREPRSLPDVPTIPIPESPQHYPVCLFPVRLEIRFMKNNKELWVRIFPDQVSIEQLRQGLTVKEAMAGLKFVTAEAKIEAGWGLENQKLTEKDKLPEKRKIWRMVTADVDAPRAAWAIRQVKVDQIFKPYQAKYPKPEAWGKPETVAILEELRNQMKKELQLAEEDEMVPAVVRTFPHHFVIHLYKDISQGKEKNEKKVYSITGKPIPHEVFVIDESELDSDLLSGKAKWLVDFEEAVKVGLGVKIPLTKEKAPFTRIIAVGMKEPIRRIVPEGTKTPAPPQEWAHMVEALLTNHQYTDGLAFLEPGTPTNNTATTASGHSESRDAADSIFDAEIQDLPPYGGDTNLTVMHRALGLPNVQALARVPNAFQKKWSYAAKDMHNAIWDGTGGFTLWSRYGDLGREGDRDDRRRFFADYVQGQGHFPVFRVGNTPYGLLPVQKIAHEGWTPGSISFDTHLHKLVSHLFTQWLELASHSDKVPRIGGGKERKIYQHDKELLQVLGMHPSSVDIQVRPFMENRFFQNHYLGLLRIYFPFDYGTIPNPIVKRLREILKLSNTLLQERQTFFQEIGQLFRVDIEKLFLNEPFELVPLPIEPFPLEPISLVEDHNLYPKERPRGSVVGGGIEFVKDSYGYLLRLLGNVPTQEAMPLLYLFLNESLKRSGSHGKETIQVVATAIRALSNVANNKEIKNRKTIVEDLFREALDVQSHRLDAWVTAFAYQRLMTLRGVHRTGLYLGAYGWLENIEAPQPEDGSSKSQGGFIHAPSLNQATAGAVVRNAYLTQEGNPHGNPYTIDLSSTRVRKALTLLDGIRRGQSLGELLGYQLERMLHDQELDHYIDNFRGVYLWEDQIPQDASANGNGRPRRVVNGLALRQELIPAEGRTTLTKTQIMQEVMQKVGIPDKDKPKDRGKVEYVLTAFCDLVDAMTDVLLYESTYQAVQGKWEHASAALKAFSGEGVPPVLESVQTHLPGTKVRHRVCLVLPDAGMDKGSQDASDLKGAIEPVLASWLSDLMGDRKTIGCQVVHPDTGVSLTYTLEALNIHPLDLLYWSVTETSNSPHETSQTTPNSAGTSASEDQATRVVGSPLEEWIRSHVRSEKGLSWNKEVQVRLDETASPTISPLGPWVDKFKALWAVIGPSLWLTPRDLTASQKDENGLAIRDQEDSNDPLQFQTNDLEQLKARRTRVKQKFESIHTRLSGFLNLSNPDLHEIQNMLWEVTQFGVMESLPSGDLDDPQLMDLAAQTLKELDRRMAASDQLVQRGEQIFKIGESAKAVQLVVEAIQALCGKSFKVLPTFSIPFPREFDQALTQTDIVGPHGTERIRSWLSEMGQTQAKVEALDDAMMYMEVDASEEGAKHLDLCVVQLPYEQDQTWVALSDAEAVKVKRGRKNTTQSSPSSSDTDDEEEDSRRGKLSLVMVGPNSWEAHIYRVGGLLIDEIIEHKTKKTVTTGLSFQYDQPNSQPPHALLLAMPSELNLRQSKPWTIDELTDIVKDTMDLAKVRAVDLDALDGMGETFPGLFLAEAPPADLQAITFNELPMGENLGSSVFKQRVLFQLHPFRDYGTGQFWHHQKTQGSLTIFNTFNMTIDFPWPVTFKELALYFQGEAADGAEPGGLFLYDRLGRQIAGPLPVQRGKSQMSRVAGFTTTSGISRMKLLNDARGRGQFQASIKKVTFSYD